LKPFASIFPRKFTFQKILFILLSSALYSFSQPDTINDSKEVDSIPKITFFFDQAHQTFLLNNFLPQKDSCENLEISFTKPFGISVLFRLNNKRIWSLDTVVHTDNTLQNANIKTAISNDALGNLREMQLFINSKSDSGQMDLKLQRFGDIPIIHPDSLLPQQSSCTIRRSVFLCKEQPAIIHEVRVFVYPSNYMKREPTLNYPELSMFHCGGSVKMPTDESVRLRGFIMNYWHILVHPPLEYGGPAKEIREKVEKPKEKKKHFFTIKPID
jgi:hypothetical protein